MTDGFCGIVPLALRRSSTLSLPRPICRNNPRSQIDSVRFWVSILDVDDATKARQLALVMEKD